MRNVKCGASKKEKKEKQQEKLSRQRKLRGKERKQVA
jgi:hypothetical protein